MTGSLDPESSGSAGWPDLIFVDCTIHVLALGSRKEVGTMWAASPSLSSHSQAFEDLLIESYRS